MSRSALRYAAVALVLAVGAVHYQQYLVLLSRVHVIGVLFLLNAAGAAALAVLLIQRDERLRRLAALGAVPLCAGSLVSILLAMGGGIFGYQEPDWRGPVVLAVIAELVAVPVLLGYLASGLGRTKAPASNG